MESSKNVGMAPAFRFHSYGKCGFHIGWIVAALVVASFPTGGFAESFPYSVDAAFENRIYPDSPSSATKSGAVTFFNGHVTRVNSPQAPNNGVAFLVNSAFGQPVASSGFPSAFLCDQTTAYNIWLQQYFPETIYFDPYQALDKWGFGANPDGDNLPNLVEYGLALDPTNPDFTPPITAQLTSVSGTNRLKIIYRRRSNDPNLVFHWFVSTDLIHWQPAEPDLGLIGSTPISSIQEGVTYLESSPVSSTSARFYRLSVAYAQAEPPCVSLAPLSGGFAVELANSTVAPSLGKR